MRNSNPSLVTSVSYETKKQDLRYLRLAIENLEHLINYDPENPNPYPYFDSALTLELEEFNRVKFYISNFCNQIRKLSAKKDQAMDLYSYIPWNLIKELDQNLEEIIKEPLNLSIINQDLKLLRDELKRIVEIEKIKDPNILDDNKTESSSESYDLSFLGDYDNVSASNQSDIEIASEELVDSPMVLDEEGLEFLPEIFRNIEFKNSGLGLSLVDIKKESAKGFFKKYNDRFSGLISELEKVDLKTKFGREAALAIIQSIGEQARNILLLSSVIDDENYKNFLKDLKKFRDVAVHDIYDWNKDNPNQYHKFRQFIEKGDVSFLEKISGEVFNLKQTGSQSAISLIVSHIKQNFISNEEIKFCSPETTKQKPSPSQEDIDWMIEVIKNSLPENLQEDPRIKQRLTIVRNLFSEKYPLPRITSELDKLFGENLTDFIKQDIAELESWRGARVQFEIAGNDDIDLKKEKAKNMVSYDNIIRKIKDKHREINDEKFKKSVEIENFQKSVNQQSVSLSNTSLALYSKIIKDSLKAVQEMTAKFHHQAKVANVTVRDLIKDDVGYKYSILFHLNAIGQAIHNLTSRKEFITTSSDELKREFSRLREIRNAIAHDYEIGGSAADISYYGNDLLLDSLQMSALRVFDSVQYLDSISGMIEDVINKISSSEVVDIGDNDNHKKYELTALLKRAFDNKDEDSIVDLLCTIFVIEVEKCEDILAFASNSKSDFYSLEKVKDLQNAIDQKNHEVCKKLLIELYQDCVKNNPELYARKYLGQENFVELEDLISKRKEIDLLCRKYKVTIDGVGGKILEYSWMEGNDSFLLVSCSNVDDLAGFKRELHNVVGASLKIVTENDVREYCSDRNIKEKPEHFIKSAKKIKLENLFDGYELYLAVEKGDLKQVKKIIKTGKPLIDINVKGYTPLHLASMTWSRNYDEKISIDICRELLKAGANPNITDKHGSTVLHNGAEANCHEICALAVKYGVDSSIKNRRNKTALDLAADNGEESGVYKYLFNFESDPIKKIISAINQGDIKTVKDLAGKIDLNKKTTEGDLILNIACQSYCDRRLQIVKTLFENGAKIGAIDGNDDNAIDCALNGSGKNLFELVSFLIGKGAKVSDKAIFTAICCDDEKLVKLLLENGSNVNEKDHLETPILHLVNVPAGNFRESEAKILETLIEFGADLTAQDEYVGNALHLAAERGNKVAVKILLDAGIDKNIKSTGTDKTATEIALQEGRQDIADLILSYETLNKKPSPTLQNKGSRQLDTREEKSKIVK